MPDNYLPTIGIECHVQLATASKLFSASNNDSRFQTANTNVSPIDFGLPGMLPRLNKHAVELSVKAGLALGSTIPLVSRFDRKHYFYPDLPKGYQITQNAEPIIGPGVLDVPLESGQNFKVRIHHAHLEEDAGKLIHPTGTDNQHSLVDLNRAGTPLIEIVSEPDMHSAQQAKAFVWELYLIMTYAEVTYGDLYHGNMRFDVNISVAKSGANKYGSRAEIKNLNSFRAVEKVVEYEFKRQVELLEKGEMVTQETRGWNDAKQQTISQRSKADAQDYRYMPEPDVPPIVLDEAMIEAQKKALPALPSVYRQAWRSLGLDSSVVRELLVNHTVAKTILSIQKQNGDLAAKRVANWFVSAIATSEEVSKSSQKLSIDQKQLVELAELVEDAALNSSAAKQVFNEMIGGNQASPKDIATKKNLLQVSDLGAIEAIVEAVLARPEAAKAVQDIQVGNDKAIGFLVGLVMKHSNGAANPNLSRQLIYRKIEQL